MFRTASAEFEFRTSSWSLEHSAHKFCGPTLLLALKFIVVAYRWKFTVWGLPLKFTVAVPIRAPSNTLSLSNAAESSNFKLAKFGAAHQKCSKCARQPIAARIRSINKVFSCKFTCKLSPLKNSFVNRGNDRTCLRSPCCFKVWISIHGCFGSKFASSATCSCGFLKLQMASPVCDI